MPDRLVLLVARPTPSGVDRRSLTGLAEQVAARVPHPVRVAYLDHDEPAIHDVLDAARDTSADEVVVVPMALPADPYLRTWIARAVANWRESAGAGRPEVRLAADPTGSTAIGPLLADLALGPTTAVTASPAAFRSPAWSVLEEPERHLFVCRGPRCAAYGAGRTHRALTAATRATTTQVTPTGCLGPCNLGPLVIDHSDGTWHHNVDADAATRITQSLT